jgi:hypothetical protein
MATNSVVTARRPFVGVWTLESFTEKTGSSEEINPLGNAPLGFLIYTAEGIVSAQLMKRDRKALGTDPWDAGGVDLTKGYIAYCGSYVIHEERGEVIHIPKVSLLPNLINQPQHRSFKFTKDTLTLVTRQKHEPGVVVESRLVWCRMECRLSQ